MSETITSVAANVVALAPLRGGSGDTTGVEPPSPTAPSPATTSQPPVRLHVQPKGEAGYVYQIVDALTGLLLAEIQRGEVQNLDPSNYVAGAIVSTRA